MSKSVLLKSSLAKKYWMALTGLFLCTFLIGHLAGNLQLFAGGEEGKRAFNEYGYFMSHNLFIKVLSYLTYISILFHAIDGFLLAYQNSKARPVKYAYTRPGTNSNWAARSMAILGSLVLIFICTHMANFWWKAKYSSVAMPLHRVEVTAPGTDQKQELYVTTSGSYIPVEGIVVKHKTELYAPAVNLKVGEGYKDLHSLTVSFFGQDKTAAGFPPNQYALFAVLFYVFSMIVLSFHLWHGVASAFQSLGVRHKKYTPIIEVAGKGFAIIVPLLFAFIPMYLYWTK